MAQLLIRNLDETTITNLKQKAQRNHRSMQAEAQRILENATQVEPTQFWKGAEEIRKRLESAGGTFSDSTEMVREDRDR